MCKIIASLTLLMGLCLWPAELRAECRSVYDPQSGTRYRVCNQWDGSVRNTAPSKREAKAPRHSANANFSQWNYDSRTGQSRNYGTGEVCTGSGVYRRCKPGKKR